VTNETLTREDFIANKAMLEAQVKSMNAMLMETDPKDFERYEKIKREIKSHLFIISLQQMAIDSYDAPARTPESGDGE
jgi:hypothetical protein